MRVFGVCDGAEIFERRKDQLLELLKFIQVEYQHPWTLLENVWTGPDPYGKKNVRKNVQPDPDQIRMIKKNVRKNVRPDPDQIRMAKKNVRKNVRPDPDQIRMTKKNVRKNVQPDPDQIRMTKKKRT